MILVLVQRCQKKKKIGQCAPLARLGDIVHAVSQAFESPKLMNLCFSTNFY